MSSFLPLLASASLFGIDATDDTDIWDILKPEDAQSLTLQIRLPYDRELERHQFDGKYSRAYKRRGEETMHYDHYKCNMLNSFREDGRILRHTRYSSISEETIDIIKRDLSDQNVFEEEGWDFEGFWIHESRQDLGKYWSCHDDDEFPPRIVLMMFRHSNTKEVHWFVGHSLAHSVQRRAPWTYYHIRHIPLTARRDGAQVYADSLVVNFATQYNNLHQIHADRLKLSDKANRAEKQLKDLKAVNEENEALEEALQSERQTLGIVFICTGVLSFVFGIICLVLYSKKTMNVEAQDNQHGLPNVNVTVMPRKLKNRPPILVDECEKFGMNDVDDVTAGEGGDLVRIARPLETAGASRKLSEELMNIQPIYQDQEGRESPELHGTSPGDTKSSEVMDDDSSGNRVVAEL